MTARIKIASTPPFEAEVVAFSMVEPSISLIRFTDGEGKHHQSCGLPFAIEPPFAANKLPPFMGEQQEKKQGS